MTETRRSGVSAQGVVALDAWVESVGRRWGRSERTVFAARLCIAELAGNVVEHGGATSAEDHIIVTLHCRSNGIGIEFLDTGAPFDPTGSAVVAKSAAKSGAKSAAQPAPSGSATEGGRGLMLVRAYAKNLSYRRDGLYNRIEMTVAPD
ncbi:MAG TPA: ATP-binding protein [Xanthobacteraceae bacterium]|nr:ATP-binding protein [Xanthobacteraceae bacterium]